MAKDHPRAKAAEPARGNKERSDEEAAENDSARNNASADTVDANPPAEMEALSAAAPLGMDPPAAAEAPAKLKDSAQEKYGPTAAGGKVDPLLPADEAPANAVIVECPYCGERCAANGGDAYFTRYYCPTKGCTYSHKLPKAGLAKRLKRDRAQHENDKGFSARP